ncbi:hypothetical protein BHR42_16475 [Aeromonas salmonicida subsp. salmonicida]|nr:hypothetical protein BHR42_16475 [Aeromonas salmonicida subsp. salmonicida]
MRMLRLLMMTALIYTGSLMAADTGLARSYVSEDAITIAKGLGDLNADQVLLSVVVDVNSHFATKCRQVASPHELAMNPIFGRAGGLEAHQECPLSGRHIPAKLLAA